VDPDNLRLAMDRLGRAGIGLVYPYQLRHSMASILIASGHLRSKVARLLDHSSPSMTLAHYANAFEEAAVRAIDSVALAISTQEA
jgi:integrase